MGVSGLYFSCQFQTGFSGQSDIHEDQIRTKGLDLAESLWAINCFFYNRSHKQLAKDFFEGLAKGGIVLNDECLQNEKPTFNLGMVPIGQPS